VFFAKIFLVAAIVGLLHSLPRFRKMSRALDEETLLVMKRAIRATEAYGYPPEVLLMLLLLAALTWVAVVRLTMPFVH
jgi:hypothetical protein